MSIETSVNILLVDDHQENLMALQAVLADLGHTLVLARSGAEALRCLLDQEFAVILLDVMMPGMDGFETAAILRTRDRTRTTPIIFLTAIGKSEAEITEGYVVGAVDYIVKPFDPKMVKAKVAIFVELYQARRTLIWQADQLANSKRVVEEHAQNLEMEVQKRTGELRSSEARFRGLIDVAVDAIISVDERQRVVLFNKGAEQIFGYAAAEVLDRPLDLLLPLRVVEAHRQHIHDFAAASETSRRMGERREIYGRRKDGTEFPAEAAISKLVRADETIFTVILRDVTERMRAEEALRKSEAQLRQAQKVESIGQLAGGIAHDFNNLLTVINSYSDMLLSETGYDSPSRHGLAEIKEAGLRAAALTRQLLAFSRQQVLEPKVLDLNAAVQNIMKLLRRLIGEDINLSICPDPNLARVKADPGQIEQVIMNLAVNARDAMPQGGQLTIETTNVELDDASPSKQSSIVPGPYVMLAVSDTGCGMDAQTQARIFEPFFTTKEPGRGTGLGLSTVYGIVRQSGGHIDVSSEVGRGTTFKIYLPRVEDEVELFESAPARPEVLRGSETILLVEDDEMVRALGQTILQLRGYTILEARNAKEALHVAEEHKGPIHLMLTDTVMPGLSGPELAERLASIRPETKVLYTSGYTDKVKTQRHLTALSAAFLQKPYTPETLTRKIREILNSSQEPQHPRHRQKV